jgi:hypothetical protein
MGLRGDLGKRCGEPRASKRFDAAGNLGLGFTVKSGVSDASPFNNDSPETAPLGDGHFVFGGGDVSWWAGTKRFRIPGRIAPARPSA